MGKHTVTNYWCKVCGWTFYVRPDKQNEKVYTQCPACGSHDTERDI